jgi:hypothetical protein
VEGEVGVSFGSGVGVSAGGDEAVAIGGDGMEQAAMSILKIIWVTTF